MPILSGGPLYRDKTKPIEDYTASTGEVFGAAAARAFDTGVSDFFARGQEHFIGTALIAKDPERFAVSGKAAKEEAARKGVKLDLGDDAVISRPELDTMMALKQREQKQQAVLARRPKTWGGFATEMAGGLAGSLADPVQVAASFIPVVPAAKYAMWLERAGSAGGRAAVRAGVGAVEGLAGAAIIEPFVYARAQSLGLDYTAQDSFLNLAFGTVLGGGLHVVGGAIHDRFTGAYDDAPRFDPPDAVSREALQQALISDGSVNVAPLFDEHAARAAVADIGRLRRQLDVVVREEDTALGAAFRSDRADVKAAASDRIAALRDEIAGLERDIASARERAATSIDDVTPTRIAAISRELAGDIPAKRRADLEAEQRLLTEGAPRTRAEEELAKGRAEAEAAALEKAKARAEKALKAEQDRLGKAAATETKGDAALAAAGKRTASRRDDVERLTARAVRRWAATVGEQIDNAKAADIAARLLASPLDGFEALARSELSALATPGNMRGMDVKPETFDPATGYEPPDMEAVRAEADRAVKSGEADTVDAEIEALNEMIDMGRARGTLDAADEALLTAAAQIDTFAAKASRAAKAAASCIIGVA